MMMNDIQHTIEAMCRQEQNGYKTADYLHQEQPVQEQPWKRQRGPLHAVSSNNNIVNIPIELVDIDQECRSKMAAWCFQVVDFCKFSRETVSIAMNLLDRFLLTRAAAPAKANRKTYQLAAMTCLYTAVKIHEPEAMDPKLVSNLSRGTYSAAEVEAMELQLLQALSWRVNPPTALAFVRHLLALIQQTYSLESYTVDTIYDLTKFQTELSCSEYDFLSVPPSTVAYCALRNALESVGIDDFALSQMSHIMAQAIGIQNNSNHNESNVETVQQWLYAAIVNESSPSRNALSHTHRMACGAVASSKQQHPTLARQTSHEVSPRSVSV
mmetsp:Transcript_4297/g.9066  ORF Transcript_4297/g.9066 Transcript_4297/m.9066 type:complete len:326 (-) Transcript_4297:48-1025(-)